LLVRARQKTLVEIPDWAKCCPVMIRCMEKTVNQEFTAIVTPFSAVATCPHCGREKDALYRETVGPIITSIAVDIYEWDEGVVTL